MMETKLQKWFLKMFTIKFQEGTKQVFASRPLAIKQKILPWCFVVTLGQWNNRLIEVRVQWNETVYFLVFFILFWRFKKHQKKKKRKKKEKFRMIRWMCDVTLKDRMPFSELREQLGPNSIRNCFRYGRLKWFGNTVQL